MRKPAPYRITREQFREWLLAQPKRRVVGYACTNRDCPTVRCITALTGLHPFVANDFSDIDDARWPNPPWLCAFTRALDEGREEWQGVTVATCLKALDIADERVERERQLEVYYGSGPEDWE